MLLSMSEDGPRQRTAADRWLVQLQRGAPHASEPACKRSLSPSRTFADEEESVVKAQRIASTGDTSASEEVRSSLDRAVSIWAKDLILSSELFGRNLCQLRWRGLAWWKLFGAVTM